MSDACSAPDSMTEPARRLMMSALGLEAGVTIAKTSWDILAIPEFGEKSVSPRDLQAITEASGLRSKARRMDHGAR